ncbi:MAG: hypothetical protein EOM62_18685 [Bacteroidia bacterium]|nr:hypothetical protein [Bacteroidia bacterium]
MRLAQHDTEMLMAVWKRVGKGKFTVREICDITPIGVIGRLRVAGVIQTTGKELRVNVWKIRPDIANRFEEFRK